MSLRQSFIDFVTGLLNMDPIKRWSPQQAKQHPFITGEKFEGHWEVSIPRFPNVYLLTILRLFSAIYRCVLE
jgi:serine/threonine protein kinase